MCVTHWSSETRKCPPFKAKYKEIWNLFETDTADYADENDSLKSNAHGKDERSEVFHKEMEKKVKVA